MYVMALKSRPVSLQLNCIKTSSFLLTSVGPRTTKAFCQRGWSDSSSKEEGEHTSSERQKKTKRSKSRQKNKSEPFFLPFLYWPELSPAQNSQTSVSVSVVHLCFVAKRPDVHHFLDLAVNLLRLAGVHQRWDVALQVVFAAQQPSFAREKGNAFTRRRTTRRKYNCL